jgi:hypothetical protein
VGEVEAASAPIYAGVTLSNFYMRRLYRPGWSASGRILPAADDLIGALRSATEEGLTPGDYHLADIERLLDAVRRQSLEGVPADPRLLADLDLLLTDTFLIYGSHLLSGRVNPETFDPEWLTARRGADLGGPSRGSARHRGGVEEAARTAPSTGRLWPLEERAGRIPLVCRARRLAASAGGREAGGRCPERGRRLAAASTGGHGGPSRRGGTSGVRRLRARAGSPAGTRITRVR